MQSQALSGVLRVGYPSRDGWRCLSLLEVSSSIGGGRVVVVKVEVDWWMSVGGLPDVKGWRPWLHFLARGGVRPIERGWLLSG